MNGRDAALLIYGVALGWYLCSWYRSERESQNEREQLLWQQIAELKARKADPVAEPAA